jgi:outer membrane protein
MLTASIALLFPWTAAFAQDAPDDSKRKDVRVRVGLGAELRPEYIGADKNEIGPLWDFDVARGSKQFKFEAPDDHTALALYSKHGFRFGPVVNLEDSRKNKDVGAPVGKVKMTFEAGAFAQYEMRDSLRFRGELRKGLGGHDGLVGSLAVDKIWRAGDKYVFSIGPRVLFSDSKYQRAYFGVTPEASIAAGIPTYRPGNGIHAVAAASGLSYQFNNRFGMFGFARYERLVGDAAKSPIVREFGSRNQWSAGAGLSYTFNLKL